LKPKLTYKAINILDTASLILVLAVSIFFTSCKSNDPEEIKALTEQLDIPSLTVNDLKTTVLDAGKIKYRLITPLLVRYENTDEPYDDFPEGLHFLSFNTKGEISSQIKCNNARHYAKTDLWELNNNVEAINEKGEILNTEQLFWDMKKKLIYSEKHVKITTKSDIINGIGFESKDDLSNYTIKNITGIVEVEE
jgi:LPS export ABC transporter protein LptC